MHACSFQDMWKRKSFRPTTSRKAGYALAWFKKKKAGVKNLFSSFLLSYFEKIAHASVVEAFVSLWLCLLGCVLQGPIRLKVL